MKKNGINSPNIKDQEKERLGTLSELSLDFEQLELEFQPVMKLASKLTGASMSFLNILDHTTQWTVARYGAETIAMPKEDSVCQFTILGDQPYEIKSLSDDDRFKDKFYVTGELGINYYYGLPISYNGQTNIGSFCVLDKKKLDLDDDQKETLKLIAEQISKRIGAIAHTRRLESQISSYKVTLGKITHEIRNQISIIVSSTELLRDSPLQQGDGDLLDAIHNSSNITLEKLVSYADKVKSLPTYPGTTTEDIGNRIDKYYGTYARQKGISLYVDNDKNETLVSISVPRVVQLIGKLIINSTQDSLNKSTIEVDLKLKKLPSIKNKCYLTVTVRDESVGYNPEQVRELNDVLNPEVKNTYFNELYTPLREQICGLLTNLKATVQVESEPGLGTSYKVEIPCEAVGFIDQPEEKPRSRRKLKVV